MQLVILAMAVAIVLIFLVGVYPNIGIVWFRAFALTVVLIAVALFVLLTRVRDRYKRRKSRITAK